MIPKGGAPQPAGLFQSDGMRALHILSGPVDVSVIGTVAVTIEPAAGSVHADHADPDCGSHRQLASAIEPSGTAARPLPVTPNPCAVRTATAC